MADVSSPVEVLRAAADRLDELDAAAEWEAWRGAQDHADMEWIEAMSPQVAPALSAWLRTEADDLREEQDSATEGCSECHGTAQVFDGDPLPFPCTDCAVTPYESGQHALTFARMVLGLPAVSDTTGEGQ